MTTWKGKGGGRSVPEQLVVAPRLAALAPRAHRAARHRRVVLHDEGEGYEHLKGGAQAPGGRGRSTCTTKESVGLGLPSARSPPTDAPSTPLSSTRRVRGCWSSSGSSGTRTSPMARGRGQCCSMTESTSSSETSAIVNVNASFQLGLAERRRDAVAWREERRGGEGRWGGERGEERGDGERREEMGEGGEKGAMVGGVSSPGSSRRARAARTGRTRRASTL